MLERSRVERWLREDVGLHDVTNDVPGATTGQLVAKEPGVAAGITAAGEVFDYLGAAVETPVEAGDWVESGDILLCVEGSARDVLRGERTATNLISHASGIATRTRTAVDAVREVSDDVAVAGTRKTTPGLRDIEKRAVAAGGGDTHRLDCSHMVMVKENHVAELGMEAAVDRFRDRASFATQVEVEVETSADAPRAVEAGADIVMVDNMSPAETATAVELVEDRALVEASGGITLDDIQDYAETGVDIVSMGSLTHSANSLDCSFRTG